MLFKRKIDKVIDIARLDKGSSQAFDLEKGDLPAMIIGAAIVIGPFLIGIIGLIFLVAWLFGAFA